MEDPIATVGDWDDGQVDQREDQGDVAGDENPGQAQQTPEEQGFARQVHAEESNMEPAELDQGSHEDGEKGVSVLRAVQEVKIPCETPRVNPFQDLDRIEAGIVIESPVRLDQCVGSQEKANESHGIGGQPSQTRFQVLHQALDRQRHGRTLLPSGVIAEGSPQPEPHSEPISRPTRRSVCPLSFSASTKALRMHSSELM